MAFPSLPLSLGLDLLSLSRLSVLDLVVALAPHADEAAISKLYSTIRPYLEVSPRGQEPHTAPPGEEGPPWRGGACLLSPCLVAAQDQVFISFLVACLPFVVSPRLSCKCQRDRNARRSSGLTC